MRIDTRFESNGYCCIRLDNSIIKRGLLFPSFQYNFADDPMPRFIKVMKRFAKGNEMFFGHYRMDGLNLTSEAFSQYGEEIPDYFKTYGRYEELLTFVEKRRKIKVHEGYLTVGSSPLTDKLYEMIPKLFHYYLETTCFCPKIGWETFVEMHRDYMKHGGRTYAMSGFTDFVFSYADSKTFSLSFDSSVYDPEAIRDEISRIVLDET